MPREPSVKGKIQTDERSKYFICDRLSPERCNCDASVAVVSQWSMDGDFLFAVKPIGQPPQYRAVRNGTRNKTLAGWLATESKAHAGRFKPDAWFGNVA
jgi:hypothetical protein